VQDSMAAAILRVLEEGRLAAKAGHPGLTLQLLRLLLLSRRKLHPKQKHPFCRLSPSLQLPGNADGRSHRSCCC